MRNDDRIESLRPQFVGKTELRVDIRTIGGKAKILVTVMDYAPTTVSIVASDKRAAKAAVDAARRYGVVSADYTRLPMGSTIEKGAVDPGTGKRSTIRVRSNTFVFAGAE